MATVDDGHDDAERSKTPGCCGSARARLDRELAEVAPAGDVLARCSPDPCQRTDRYRLAMPFSLRL